MIRLPFTCIFSLAAGILLVLLCSTQSKAQQVVVKTSDSLTVTNEIDSTTVVPAQEAPQEVEDSVEVRKFLSGVELLVDYGKLLTLWTKFETKFEGGINIRFFRRLVLAAEGGYAELNPLKAYDNALYYTVKGPYGRLGLDYYGAYNPTSFFYAGIRYGATVFEDDGAFLIDSEYWEDYEEGFGSTDITASWFEIVLGTEAYLNLKKEKSPGEKSKWLIGCKFRFRILGDFTNREKPTIYSIPGYGRTFDETVPALNLYVKYRFGN